MEYVSLDKKSGPDRSLAIRRSVDEVEPSTVLEILSPNSSSIFRELDRLTECSTNGQSWW